MVSDRCRVLMLELVAQVDPLAAVMAGLWLFAAGLFPVGIMLGAQCSACCGCNLCAEGSLLPETLTVTFDGLPNQTPTDVRVAPTLTLGGTATATVSVTQNPGVLTWGVSGVTVTAGGTGYTEGAAATFTLGTDDVQETAAVGTIRVVHDAPENAVVTILDPDGANPSTGTGAVLVPTWELLPTNQWPAPHKKTYKLTGMTVTNGGSGYANYDIIEISFASADDGTVIEAAYIDADVVGTGGVIQQVWVADADDIDTPAAAGKYIGSRTDALHSVLVTSGGSYYKLTTEMRNTHCCGHYYDGMSVVVKRNAPVPDAQPGGPCTYSHYMCGVGNGGFNPGAVYVQYKGPDEPPIVRLYSETTAGNSDDVASLLCNTTFTAGANVTDCGNWSGLEFSADNGATATVSTGGEYDPLFRNPGGFGACHICCKGEESPPQEIEATINDPRTTKTGGDRSGTYVLAAAGPVLVDGFGTNFFRGPGRRWVGSGPGVGVNVFIEPCSEQFRATNTPPYRAAVPGEFRPDDQGCDFCHNKCRVWAWVSFGTALGDCNWFSDRACGVCEDTPVCTVAGRTIAIGGTCGQMTVEVA